MIQFNSWVRYIILILFSGLISSLLISLFSNQQWNWHWEIWRRLLHPILVLSNIQSLESSNVHLPEIKAIANQRYLYLNSLGKIYLKHLGEEEAK